MTIAWEGYRLGGRYELQEMLGEGGMSVVYKAFDHNMKRTVAVKIIHPHLAKDPDFVHRFEAEARALAQLRHPNVVGGLDFAQEGELYYIVMEYIPGETLQAILERLRERGERLPVEEAVRLMIRLADGVDYAHRQGMVHRDLKPGNVIITPEGEPVLTDFGLARMIGGMYHTRTGMVLGTVLYMAPEQVRGEHVDHRADIYALGVMLFELLTNHLPFSGNGLAEIMQQHLEGEIPDPREWAPDLPEALVEIVHKALAKSPDDRFQSAAAFKAALEQFLAGEEAALPAAADHTVVEEDVPVTASGTVMEEPARAGAGKPVSDIVAVAAELTSSKPGKASSRPGKLASLVARRQGDGLYHTAALEGAMLAGVFGGTAYLTRQPWLLWAAAAWWVVAVGFLLRYAPAWWRLSTAYRLALVSPEEKEGAEEGAPQPGLAKLAARFRVPRLDFPHDVELMGFPAALSVITTTGVGLAAMWGASRLALAVVWLVIALLLLVFHLRFMALNFLQPGVLNRVHFGHLWLSLSFGVVALPGVALAADLPFGLREGVLMVALGAFSMGGMLGALTVIFLLQRALSTGLPRPALAPLMFAVGPIIVVYALFSLLLLQYVKGYGVTIPQIVFSLVVLTAWGIALVNDALAVMVYRGYQQAGVPAGPLMWGVVDIFAGIGLLAVATDAIGIKGALVVGVGLGAAVLGALVFLWVWVRNAASGR